MASDHNSLLRFSVEESIWFQKGQEVEELYSLSLDPNVTVQDMDQYVVIKGELFLAGEYKREQSSIREEDESFSFVSPKTIRTFEEREDGLFEFQHSFPVDITIPANRISSLEDVSVTISSFDYSMPERNCLTLCAELMISGIYGEQQNAPEPQAELIEEELLYRSAPSGVAEVEVESGSSPYYYNSSIFAPPDTDLYTPFEAEAKKLPEEESAPETISSLFKREENTEPELQEIPIFHENAVQEEVQLETEEVPEPEPIRTIEAASESEFPSEEAVEEAVSPTERTEAVLRMEEVSAQNAPETEKNERLTQAPPIEQVFFSEEKKAGRTFELPVQQAEPKQQKSEIVSRLPDEVPVNSKPELTVEQQEEQETPLPAAVYEQEPEERADFVSSAPVQELKKEDTAPLVRERSQAAQEKESQSSKGSKESVSLIDFFGRKEEQEHIKVKVCLVQQGDTLNSLASRYEISANAILSLNELDSASEISEGQVLYIPSKPVSQKR
ncbi:stage VI sporulation protein D [Peribacillus deserti]|nr:stage VI sporulation protein D [Peribacillus deserti]